jgi:hypothetical protein
MTKKISTKEYESLRKAALEGVVMERSYLESRFPRAFSHISRIASELNKDKWEIEVIRKYFLKQHNSVVDKLDAPEEFKDMCRVNIAKVVQIEEEKKAVVKYGKGKKRKVFSSYIPNLEIGDNVAIHWQYAVEKVI